MSSGESPRRTDSRLRCSASSSAGQKWLGTNGWVKRMGGLINWKGWEYSPARPHLHARHKGKAPLHRAGSMREAAATKQRAPRHRAGKQGAAARGKHTAPVVLSRVAAGGWAASPTWRQLLLDCKRVVLRQLNLLQVKGQRVPAGQARDGHIMAQVGEKDRQAAWPPVSWSAKPPWRAQQALPRAQLCRQLRKDQNKQQSLWAQHPEPLQYNGH